MQTCSLKKSGVVGHSYMLILIVTAVSNLRFNCQKLKPCSLFFSLTISYCSIKGMNNVIIHRETRIFKDFVGLLIFNESMHVTYFV